MGNSSFLTDLAAVRLLSAAVMVVRPPVHPGVQRRGGALSYTGIVSMGTDFQWNAGALAQNSVVRSATPDMTKALEPLISQRFQGLRSGGDGGI